MKDSLKSETVSFTTKGRIVIPAHFRRELQIESGTKAVMTITPGGILLRPISRDYIRSLRGSLKGKGVKKALAADRRKERGMPRL
jgi:AbrB family looped-hinge helix DNA binding protein